MSPSDTRRRYAAPPTSPRRRRRRHRIRLQAVVLRILLLLILIAAVGRVIFWLLPGDKKDMDDSLESSGVQAETKETETEPILEDGSISSEYLKSLWQSGEYPDSLLEALTQNTEMLSFVLNYPEKGSLHQTIDLTGEVTQGEIPLFLQWDERWGYEIYGSDIMAITGCGPTCLSMVYCGLTGDASMNPYAVAQMAEAEGYYEAGSGSTWTLMSEGASLLGLTVTELTLNESRIRDTLEEGYPIISIMGPGDFTDNGHFIVLVGVGSDGSILIHDPYSQVNSETPWDLDVLMDQMRNLWSFRYE